MKLNQFVHKINSKNSKYMSIQIGDKIKFLNEAGGGKITQLIDKDTVMVLSDEDNFEIPVLLTEIIAINKDKSAEKESVKVFSGRGRSFGGDRACALFAAESNTHSLYILNATSRTLLLGVFEEQKLGNSGIFSGILQPNSIQKVNNYLLKEFEAILQWRVQGFYFEKHLKKLKAPLDCAIKIHPKKLFVEGNRKFVEELGQEAIVIPLEQPTVLPTLKSEDMFSDVPKEASMSNKVKRKNTRELLEIDLHIHKLLETTTGMTNGEILDHQLGTFQKILLENKKYKGKRIVFIHGVGNGVLKQRIRHELQKHPNYTVQDASFQEYGWGATMVIIR